MKKFQLFLLIGSGALLVIGVILFATLKSSSSQTPRVAIWGSIPQAGFTLIQEAANLGNKNKDIVVTYKYVAEDKMEDELVDALAEGRAPDLVIAQQALIVKESSKFKPVPFVSYPEKNFKSNFIDGGWIMMGKNGVMGFPLYIDPLVMYWNKRIFSNAGIINPPTTWTDLQNKIVPLLTKRTTNRADLTESAVALGTWDNITNARMILTTLLFQSGTTIIKNTEQGLENVLSENPYNSPLKPALSALVFYTDYANPLRANYSWNNAKSSDLSEFLAENNAIYFGRASEYPKIKEKNPNLAFDISPVPQNAQSPLKVVNAPLYTIGITRSAKSLPASVSVISALLGAEAQKLITSLYYYAPASRALVGKPPTDNSALATIYSQAVISKDWLDPDYELTTGAMREAVRDINSGKSTATDALQRLNSSLTNIISSYAKKF